MSYQPKNLSRVVAILLVAALVRNYEFPCQDKTIHYDGPVCSLDGDIYTSGQAMCNDLNAFDTLSYCLNGDCTDCAVVESCSTYATNNVALRMQYTAAQDSPDYPSTATCKMYADEQCVRKGTNDPEYDNFSQLGGSDDSEPDCCTVECSGKYAIKMIGCGSDSLNYSTNSDFCAAYCKNRSLTYTECGTGDCNASRGCPSAYDTCVANFNLKALGNVCGTNGTLYTTADAYCQDRVADVTGDYDLTFCSDTGCVQTDCDALTCVKTLLTASADMTTVCGTSGILHNSVNDYCKARSLGNETSYFSSDSGSFTEAECCQKGCGAGIATFNGECASDFAFYETKDAFCVGKCTWPSLTIKKCASQSCTKDQCCDLSCLNTHTLDRCNATDFNVITAASYCNGGCVADAALSNTIACKDANNKEVACKAADCAYHQCLSVNIAANGESHKYCGLNGTLYASAADYCDAKEIDLAITGEVACASGSCGSDIECCRNYCQQVVYNANNPFANMCATSQYAFISDVADYCIKSCTTGTFAPIEEKKCNNSSCSEAGCCSLRCQNLNDKSPVCSADYKLITATECDALCGDNTGFKTCDGECTQDKCNLMKCVDDNSAYVGTKVCASNGNALVIYDNDTAYCTAKAANANITAFACTDNGVCGEEKDCCMTKCLVNNAGFTGGCDNNYNMFSTPAEYCDSFCDGNLQMLQCDGNNCNLDQCCVNECKSETYHDSCKKSDFSLVNRDTFCATKCSNSVQPEYLSCKNGKDEVVQCTDCKSLKCVAQTEAFTHTNVCLSTALPDNKFFFTSKANYCSDAVTTNVTDYTIIETLCKGGECTSEENCCEAKCLADTNNKDGCDTTSNEFIDVARFCSDKCMNDTVHVLDNCNGAGCTQNYCAIAACQATLTSSVTHGPTICLRNQEDKMLGFYNNLEEYCGDLVDEGITVSVDNFAQIACGNNGCVDDKTCCDARCHLDILHDTCEDMTFKFLSVQDRCDNICAGNDDVTVVKCTNGDNDDVNCMPNNCLVKGCVHSNDTYDLTAVCLKSDKDTFVFYKDTTEFCDRAIKSSSSTDIGTDYFKCNDGNCVDDKDCCKSVCLAETYDALCDAKDYHPVEADEYCTNMCADADYEPVSCATPPCNIDTCNIKKCEDKVNEQYNLTSVCLAGGFENFFYDTVADYCFAKVEAKETDYVFSEYKECDSDSCINTEACCNARCLATEGYNIGCNAETHTLVDHVAACAYSCKPQNQQLEQNMCLNKDGSLTDCTSCELFKCLAVNTDYKTTSICLNKEVGNDKYFADLNSYCDAKIMAGETDYAINSVVSCGADQCNPDTCCNAVCNQDLEYEAKCDADNFAYVDLKDSCADLCGSAEKSFLTCEGGCDEDDCKVMKCVDSLSSYADGVCMEYEYPLNSGTTYYKDNKEYCEAKVHEGDTTYTVSDPITCGDQTCSSDNNCCKARCTTKDNKNFCEAYEFRVIEEEEYCADFCGEKKLQKIECFADDKLTDCTDCSMFECKHNYSDLFNKSQTTPGICGNNDTFYPTLDAFCADKLSKAIDSESCGTNADDRVACANDKACCLANCHDSNKDTYVPRCDVETYTFHEDYTSYCEAFCSNNRTFNAYVDGSDYQNKEECCTKNCVKNDMIGKDVCDAETYDLYTLEEQCADTCAKVTKTPLSCDDKCDQKDCDVFKCELQTLAGFSANEKICATNSTLYTNKADYCDKFVNEPLTATVVECTDLACDIDNDCCAQNCINEHKDKFSPTCDVMHNLYTTVKEFCVALCGKDEFAVEMCDGDICNADQCCAIKCKDSEYMDVCEIYPGDALVKHDDYCDNMCKDADYENKIHKCGDKACTPEDCHTYNCETGVAEVFGDKSVCGDNNTYYTTVKAYCADYTSENVENYVKCDDEICEGEVACCEAVCDIDNANFNGACLSNHTWIDDESNFCSATCGDKSLTVMHNCGSTFDLPCTEEDCCYKQCIGGDYAAKCSDVQDFTVLSHEDYCHQSCHDKEAEFLSCEGGCTEDLCGIQRCVAQLGAIFITDTCMDASLNESYYFANVDDYCEAYMNKDKHTYDLGENFQCGDACKSDHDCCMDECRKEDYLDSCDKSEHKIVDQEAYCGYRCDNSRTDMEVDMCMNADNKQVRCDNCAYFACQQANKDYKYTTVCLDAPIGDDQFFNTVNAYCAKIAEEAPLADSKLTEFSTCGSSGCEKDKDCCLDHCNNNSQYFDGCETDSSHFVSKVEFCEAKCSDNPIDVEYCDGIACVPDQCRIKQCLRDNANELPTVCIAKDNLNTEYYENHYDFCLKKKYDEDNYGFQIVDAITCGNEQPCTSPEQCCVNGCKREKHVTACTKNFQLSDSTDQCTNYCRKNQQELIFCKDEQGENVDCDDCEAFKCMSLIGVAEDTPICLATDADKNFSYYNDSREYCDNLIYDGKEYTIGQQQLCDGNACDADDKCCEAVCNNSEYKGYCKSDDLEYINQSDYCSDFCGSNLPKLEDCEGTGCTENMCKEKQCAKLFGDDSSEQLCLSMEYKDKYFFNEIASFCSMKVLAGDSNYLEDKHVDCGPIGGCIDDEDCCNARCMTESYVDSCSKSDHNIINQQAFCDFRCKATPNVDMEVDQCLNEDNKPVPCDKCDKFACLANMTTAYSTDANAKVCAFDYEMYNTSSTYCDAYIEDNSLGYVKCNDNVCSSPENCCNAVCAQVNDGENVAGCDDMTFQYVSDVSEYCSAYCGFSRSFNYFMVEGEKADDKQCCTQKCINDGSSDFDVCDGDSFSLVKLSGRCADSCENKVTNYVPCKGNCVDSDCAILSCVNDLKAHTNIEVCGTDGVFYDTKKDYCSELLNVNSNLKVQTCANGDCTTGPDCCEAKCVADRANNFASCDSNFNIFSNVQDFCKAKCSKEGITEATCGTELCTARECCFTKCNIQDYSIVCKSNTSEELYLLEDYCDAYCADNSVEDQVHRCESGFCTEEDCKINKCEHELATVFSAGVCGVNGEFYTTLHDYCVDLIGNKVSNYRMCAGNKPCTNETTCCNANCHVDNDSFSGACMSDYQFIDKLDDFCNATCGIDISELKTCGAGKNDRCNEADCCQKECHAQPFRPVCDTSYDILDQDAYCNLYCPDKAYVAHTCDGDCSPQICQKDSCMNSLDTHNGTICVNTSIKDQYFFDGNSDFCDKLFEADSQEYNLDDAVKCDGNDCNSEKDCYVARCIPNSSFIKSCRKDDNTLFDASMECAMKYANEIIDLDMCYDGDTQVPCEDCEIFKCYAANADQAKNVGICLPEVYEDKTYYDNLKQFCETKISEPSNNYAIGAQTECQNGACTKESECCNANCNKNETMYDRCGSDYEIYNVADQCDDICAKKSVSSEGCQTDCKPSDCLLMSCEESNAGHTGPVCISDTDKDYLYFNDLRSYCSDSDIQAKDNMAIENELECSNKCGEKSDCCIGHCMTTERFDVCHPTNYQVIAKDDTCPIMCKDEPIEFDKCFNDNDEQVDCTSCEVFKCESALTTATDSICLVTPILTDKFYFKDGKTYCDTVAGEMADYTVGETTKCDGQLCAKYEDCCATRCLRDPDVKPVCNADTFNLLSVVDYCTGMCNGTVPAVIECDGDGCSPDKCKHKECESAIKGLTANEAFCFSDTYNNKNFYDSIPHYCDAVLAEGDDDKYTVPQQTACGDKDCASEEECCIALCESQPAMKDVCDVNTFGVVSVKDLCTASCKNQQAVIFTNCWDDQLDKVHCRDTDCLNAVCLYQFSDYVYNSVCLTQPHKEKSFFDSVSKYCDDMASDSVQVKNRPSVATCDDDNNNPTSCAKDTDCCYANCRNTVHYTGCTADKDLKTAAEICTAQCAGKPFVITQCGNQNCTTCANSECFAANTDYAQDGICMTELYSERHFFNDINEFCTAKAKLDDTDYSLAGKTVKCDDKACEDPEDCCIGLCVAAGAMDQCDSETYDVVTKKSQCAAVCAQSPVNGLLGCTNPNGQEVDCDAKLCAVQHKCPAIFALADYNHTSVCLSDGDDDKAYYDTVADFCAANSSLTELPEIVKCADDQDNSVDCKEDSCCYNRCMADDYKIGCDSDFELVPKDKHCHNKCSDQKPIEQKYCGDEDCQTCLTFECEAAFIDYKLDTVCLASPLDDTSYFKDIKTYCGALILAENTDFSYTATDFTTCDGEACDKGTCCNTNCRNSGLKDACSTTNYSVVSVDDQCDVQCAGSLQVIGLCYDDLGQQIDCNTDLCCEMRANDLGHGTFCGSDGTMYTSASELCAAIKSDDVELVECGDQGCTVDQCDRAACLARASENTFPLCGSDGEVYATAESYCDAYKKDESVTMKDICPQHVCTKQTCCNATCSDDLKAVLYTDKDGKTAGFQNLCLAQCEIPDITVTVTCEDNESIEDCITHNTTDCAIQCADLQTDTTTTYCSEADGFLSAFDYCQLYTCHKGSKYGEDFSAVRSCTGYDCTSDQCAVGVCNDKQKCHEMPIVVGCYNDQNAYANACYATCAAVTSFHRACKQPENVNDPAQFLESITACKNTCADAVCDEQCLDKPFSPVCAADGNAYDNECLAKCYGIDVKWACPTDCKNEPRMLRCKYDCKNSVESP